MMKLLFQNETYEFISTPSVEEVIEKINDLLGKEYYFSHFDVDGNEISVEPEQYLQRFLGEVEQIEVIAIGAKQFVNDLLVSAENYLAGAIPKVTELAEAFYNNPVGDNWLDLNDLLEGVGWLGMMIETVEASIVRPENWAGIVQAISDLQNEFEPLEEALENTDTVLIGDILQYEVVSVFEELFTGIQGIIDNEGIRHDIS